MCHLVRQSLLSKIFALSAPLRLCVEIKTTERPVDDVGGHQHLPRLPPHPLRRGEIRHQRRELRPAHPVGHQHSGKEDAANPGWQHVAPELDAAIDELDDDDRAAILARYFEKKEFAEIGPALGASEGAAQRRVSRAVEKLRGSLSGRGVTLGVATLATMLGANAVQAAPAHLAAAAFSAGWAGAAKVGAGWFAGAKVVALAGAALLVAGRAWLAVGEGNAPVALAATPAAPDAPDAPDAPAAAPVAAPVKPARADDQKFGVWKAAKFEWKSPEAALRRPVVFNVTLPAGHTRFTVVLENADGLRVRNLLDAANAGDFGGDAKSGQPQTLALEWNGLDDRGEALPDGDYRVRSCSHAGVTLAYDYSILGAGTPPWEGYKNSAWGGDHEFPQAIACVPGGGAWRVLVGGRTAEGGSPGFVLDAAGPQSPRLWQRLDGAEFARVRGRRGVDCAWSRVGPHRTAHGEGAAVCEGGEV